jgi:hypothetical protein
MPANSILGARKYLESRVEALEQALLEHQRTTEDFKRQLEEEQNEQSALVQADKNLSLIEEPNHWGQLQLARFFHNETIECVVI